MSKWVRADIRLPEIYQPVLIWCLNMDHKIGWLNIDNEWIFDIDVNAKDADIDVTHWAKLPDPPIFGNV